MELGSGLEDDLKEPARELVLQGYRIIVNSSSTYISSISSHHPPTPSTQQRRCTVCHAAGQTTANICIRTTTPSMFLPPPDLPPYLPAPLAPLASTLVPTVVTPPPTWLLLSTLPSTTHSGKTPPGLTDMPPSPFNPSLPFYPYPSLS